MDIIGAALIAIPDFLSPQSFLFSQAYGEYKRKEDRLDEEKRMLFRNNFISVDSSSDTDHILSDLLKEYLNAPGNVTRINRRPERGGEIQLQFAERENSDPLSDVIVGELIEGHLNDVKRAEDRRIRIVGIVLLVLGILSQAASYLGGYLH
ncbi:hypothetical protein ACFQE8_02955 [Salinirubellus sp. GCM10025818]|uniref:hypothetical protein n=1 Tax=Salinirubellus TaxID=2162630 RepID=UPI0030CD8596